MSEIILYTTTDEDIVKLGKTSKIVDLKITKELMRIHTAEFTLMNDNPLCQLIDLWSFFKIDGQLFDITGKVINSGTENTTSVTCEHFSYRLLNYNLPANFTFTGSLYYAVYAILENSKNLYNVSARSEFTPSQIGFTYPDITVTVNIGKECTPKYAFLWLCAQYNLELDFYVEEGDKDSCKVRFYAKIGTIHSTPFKFGKNLVSFKETWDKINGSTYEADIADSEETVSIGDTLTFYNKFFNKYVTSRVISIVSYPLEPFKNTITLGVFKNDISNDIANLS